LTQIQANPNLIAGFLATVIDWDTTWKCEEVDIAAIAAKRQRAPFVSIATFEVRGTPTQRSSSGRIAL
jgi:hypothetical protein